MDHVEWNNFYTNACLVSKLRVLDEQTTWVLWSFLLWNHMDGFHVSWGWKSYHNGILQLCLVLTTIIAFLKLQNSIPTLITFCLPKKTKVECCGHFYYGATWMDMYSKRGRALQVRRLHIWCCLFWHGRVILFVQFITNHSTILVHKFIPTLTTGWLAFLW